MDKESYFKGRYKCLDKYIYTKNIDELPLGCFVKTINKYTNKLSIYGFVCNKLNNNLIIKSNKYYRISMDNYYIFFTIPQMNKLRGFLETFIMVSQ